MSDGLHHLHARKRLYKSLAPYPHPEAWKRYFDYLMYGVAIFSPVALLPQVFHLFKTQDASGLSLPTWILLGCLNILWLMYGIIHRETPLIISNILFTALYIAVVGGIVLYA